MTAFPSSVAAAPRPARRDRRGGARRCSPRRASPRRRLDDIAARAGVSKGALYLYFETKEDIFRAVVQRGGRAQHRRACAAMARAYPGPFGRAAAPLMHGALSPASSHEPASAAVVKMVVGEAGNFPELARVWHDDVVAAGLGAARRR